MVHLLAEAAEMRRQEEVAMDAGRLADGAAVEQPPDAADGRDIAAVLDDRVDPPGVARPRRSWRAPLRGWRPAAFRSADGSRARKRSTRPRVAPRERRRRRRCPAWSGRELPRASRRWRRHPDRTRPRGSGRARRRCRPARRSTRSSIWRAASSHARLMAPQPTSTASEHALPPRVPAVLLHGDRAFRKRLRHSAFFALLGLVPL